MLKNIEAVIFDLDGTMIDSMGIWTELDLEYLKKYQLTMPEHFEEGMEGKSYTQVAQYFLDIFPNLQKTVDEIKQEWNEMVYEKYTKELELKDGLYEFLLYLRQHNFKCGIATSNDRMLVEATLKALQVDSFFKVIRTSCEVPAGKPAPDVYLKVAEELEADPARCLVFEDVPMGIMAGKRAGMMVCAVDDDFSKAQEPQKRELAHYYIHHYDQIVNQTYEVLR